LVLVSEVMLQQTQVARVAAAYAGFVDRFPTPGACAEAGVASVLRAWAGLGYNRRARHLHQAALSIVARHGGIVPADLRTLKELPGVGDYTARAVLVFAYERDEAVVDVNVARVLSRAVTGSCLTHGQAQELADALMPPGASWEWNQALVDLGAMWCTARRPDCRRCPLSPVCTWANSATARPDPAPRRVRQVPFEGSDRQGRGRLVTALRSGPVSAEHLAHACGWPGDAGRARRIADGLIADGLVRWGTGDDLVLA
jgi:A/G-specific adenine glycosylase